jgi:hypothetical protein
MGLGVGLSGRRPAVCSSGNGAGFRPQCRWEAARSATCLGSQLTVRATVPGGALSEAAPAAAQAGTVTAELAGSKHHHTTREQQQLWSSEYPWIRSHPRTSILTNSFGASVGTSKSGRSRKRAGAMLQENEFHRRRSTGGLTAEATPLRQRHR